MLLRARDLAHFYGPRLIFKDICLDLPPGALTVLAGANGAGKSTLLKILAGLIRPSTGSVETGENSRGQKPRIGYLGHQTFIYPELTALENLRFWTSLHGHAVTGSDYAAILERVELAPFAEEKARGFSRGMAQRLNLARVFLLEADILLLDEPGTGLDLRSSAVLLREILAARDKGAGIIWITHNLEEDLRHADSVAFLEGKRLAFYGPAEAFRLSERAPVPRPEPFETREARGGEPC